MKIKQIITDYQYGKFWEETTHMAEELQDCMNIVNVYPEVTYQKMRGFGGAFTEASAHNYARMSEENRKVLIEATLEKEDFAITLAEFI